MALTTVSGKTAFITGGGKGIGLGVARALVRGGANVMLADIDAQALSAAAAELGDHADTVHCDVADSASLKAAADKTIARFGKVHILMNNAGVSSGGAPGETALEDWRWVVDINLLGVVYGVETFVPLIKSHGEGGHIVNTASFAGHVSGPGTNAPYTATKFAVVGYSEMLRGQLAKHGIGCSALCPGWVATDIHKSGFRAPSNVDMDVAHAMEDPRFQRKAARIKSGLSPDLIGEWVVESMLADRMHIFTHPSFLGDVERRFEAVRADYQACLDDPRFADA